MGRRMERMADAFVEDDGTRWTVWLLGDEAGDGLWDGALEFAGDAGVAVLRTPPRDPAARPRRPALLVHRPHARVP